MYYVLCIMYYVLCTMYEGHSLGIVGREVDYLGAYLVYRASPIV